MTSLEVTSDTKHEEPEKINEEKLLDNDEDPEDYCEGGYHSVHIGDMYGGRYRVVRKLGWGQYSTVWLSWDKQDKREVALKIGKSSSEYRDAAITEIQLLECAANSNPRDPNSLKIVQLLDQFQITGENGVHVVMVFELLGDNLSKLIRKSKGKGLPLALVKSIIRQVLEAVDYLHSECKIIHTDIKPENILICPENIIYEFEVMLELNNSDSKMTKSYKKNLKRRQKLLEKKTQQPDTVDSIDEVCDVSVKVADLGNACWVDYHFNNLIQSLHYRSPEVIVEADYGPSADIWSVACVAFELATGDYLFDPKSSKHYSRSECHLALMIELLGYIPKQIALAGKNSIKYFNNKGNLRHVSETNPNGLCDVLVFDYEWDVNEAEKFSEFLLPMLDYDVNKRASAIDCIKHQWLQS